tara:strand:- start:1378 stop:2805 length:1428 start_codon:yes stop_codon:yes gene_type:complete
MSKIFEEAIADAKKLKEIAEENAKQAILESVTPKIREFIEEQLLESEEISEIEEDAFDEGKDIEKDYSDDLEEHVYLDESALQSLVNLLGEDTLDSLNESKSKDALIDAVKGAVSSMEETDREKLLTLSNRINENADYLSRDKGENDMSRKYYEVDLRTLRESVNEEEESKNSDVEENELMQELSRLFEQEDAEDDLSLELGEEDEEASEEAGGETLLKSEVESEIQELIDSLGLSLSEEDEAPIIPDLETEEDEEVGEAAPEDLQEVFEIDPKVLRQEINRVKRMMAEGKVDHNFGGKGDAKAGVDGSFGGKGNKNAGVKGAFGGGKEGQDAFTNPPQINKLNEAIRHLRRQNRSQTEKLNKYRGAVNSLREQLEELNLFNAKLLYVNKLLQNKALTESQKKSVIKALDEANNLQEAKSLYSSLTETLSRSTDKKTLSESRVIGSSSKSTTSSQTVKPSSANNEVSRWQKLAGL